MVEKLSEPTTGYLQDGGRYGDGNGVAVNRQENEMLVVLEEEEPMKGHPPSSNNNKVWAISVKPFVNGGLSGFLTCSQLYFSRFLKYHLAKGIGASQFKHLRSYYPTMFTGMPIELLRFSAYSSLELGSFETLTRKVEVANKVMPLTLHQEVYYGLASGAITACVSTPIYLSKERMASDATPSNVLQNLYHTAKDKGVLALWKDGRHDTIYTMALSMAGAVSGFCGLACCIPVLNVNATMKNMRADASGKYPYTSFLDCAYKLWKSRRARPFHAGFPKSFIARTPAVMAMWWYLEKIREKNAMD